MKLITAIASMENGNVIFADELDDRHKSQPILDGMVANAELGKCQHGGFTWYFAWKQKINESEADKAYQMVKALRK